MSEKKSSRRNSVRKLFGTGSKKDDGESSTTESQQESVYKGDMSASEDDDGSVSQSGEDKKSKSRLRRLSKTFSKEYNKSPVGGLEGESEEKSGTSPE
ncbi:hypothetical protein M1146_04815, partial [Patescibacteria group bacterium]|nr:hypothetical protein [Patescibacteria group bacterium]